MGGPTSPVLHRRNLRALRARSVLAGLASAALALLVARAVPAQAAAPRPAAAHVDAGQGFTMAIASNMNMDAQGEKLTLDAATELQYTWRRSGRERVLSFDSALVMTFEKRAGKR